MKTKHIFSLIIIASLATLASCIDGDWDNPNGYTYGNDKIEETNVITIAQLKKQFAGVLTTNSAYQQVTTDIKIEGVVTGNDNGGNLYNQIALQDASGALLVCVRASGLFAYLPVGQKLLIDLNGLYVGNYGKQPQIGTPYTNEKGKTYLGMTSATWEKHVRLMDKPDEANLPSPMALSTSMDIAENCGKLVTFTAVLDSSQYNVVFAPNFLKDAGNGVDRTFTGYKSTQIVLRTSAYADFAKDTIPSGKVQVTGIATRFNNVWQILMRTGGDIKKVN